jgi:hypothetical protein
MIRIPRRAATCLLVLIHGLVLLLTACVFPAPDTDNHVLSLSLGVLYAEIALLVVWFVFSARPLRIRLLGATIGLVILCASFCAYVVRTSGPGEVCAVWIGVCLTQWSLTQIPLWLTKSSGWALAKANGQLASCPKTSQFHIRHLFAWTTAIAVLFGIGNAAQGWLGGFHGELQSWLAFFGLLTTTNVLIAGPVVWATLVRDGRARWIVVSLLSILLLTPLEVSLFGHLSVSQRMLHNGLLFLLTLNTIYVAGLFTALLVTRGFGWRLARVDPETRVI